MSIERIIVIMFSIKSIYCYRMHLVGEVGLSDHCKWLHTRDNDLNGLKTN